MIRHIQRRQQWKLQRLWSSSHTRSACLVDYLHSSNFFLVMLWSLGRSHFSLIFYMSANHVSSYFGLLVQIGWHTFYLMLSDTCTSVCLYLDTRHCLISRRRGDLLSSLQSCPFWGHRNHRPLWRLAEVWSHLYSFGLSRSTLRYLPWIVLLMSCMLWWKTRSWMGCMAIFWCCTILHKQFTLGNFHYCKWMWYSSLLSTPSSGYKTKHLLWFNLAGS